MYLKKYDIFYKNLRYTTIASLLSFAISFLLTPLMTRWYTPADYGTFAVINNVATFIATAMLFSLPNAIPLEKFWYKRVQLLRSLFDLVFFTLILTSTGVIVYIFNYGESFIFLLLPLLVFAISVHRIAQGWANADAAFSSMAVARIIHPIVAKPFAIITSALMGSTPVYIVLFEILGYFSQIYVLLKKRWKKLLKIGNVLSIKRIKKTLTIIKKYRDFSLYLNLISLLTLGFLTLQVVIVSSSYSISQTGLFTLALTMVSLPIQLVSMATAAIVYHKFIELSHERPRELFSTLVVVFLGYITLGVIPYTLLYLYGEELFSFVFGIAWHESGLIASVLALPMFLQFVSVPLTSLFRVTHKIKLQFIIDSIFLIPIVVIFYSFSLKQNFFSLIHHFSMMMVVYNTFMIISIGYITWEFSKLFKEDI